MAIKVLDKSTIQHLHSGQVIVDLQAIIKELVENALDAHAKSIELLLINEGLESIQLKDDGDGIAESDRSFIAKCHYTSKLNDFSDLERVQSYGFRGEALHAICSVSDCMTIATKTKTDPIGKQYDLNKEGTITNERPTNLISSSGTIITLHKAFYNIPVRRQLAQKNAAQNLKKIHDLLTKYALAYPNVRFSCQVKGVVRSNAKSDNNTWIKPVTNSIEDTISIVFGSELAHMLERFIETDPNHPTLTVEIILPKTNADPNIVYKGSDRIYVYVNQRPINYTKSELKDLIATIRNRFREAIGISDSKKNPFIYLDIKIAPDEYDVNIEPNKTAILFHNKQLVHNLIDKVLDTAYPAKTNSFFAPKSSSSNSKPQLTRSEKTLKVAEQEDEPLFVSDTPKEADQVIPQSALSIDDIDNNDNSWSFSMMLSDSDELASEDEKTADKPRKTAAPITNWQIDDTETVALEAEEDIIGIPLAIGGKVSKVADKSPARTLDDSASTNKENEIAEASSIITEPPTIRNAATIIPQKRSLESTGTSTPELSPLPKRFDSLTFDNQTSLSPARISVGPINSRLTLQKDKGPITHHRPALHSIDRDIPYSRSPQTRPVNPSNQLNLMQIFGQQNRVQEKIATPTVSSKLCITLNTTRTIQCDIGSIRSNYAQFKQRQNIKSRMGIQDYLAANHVPSNGAKLLQLSHNAATDGIEKKHGLSFYTRSGLSEIGIVKLKAMHVNRILKDLQKNCKLICKRMLQRPVQMIFSDDDSLCPTLLSLESKETLVDDDEHGNKQITYSDITDERIINNGFRARWKRDHSSDHITVQLTAIYSFGSSYGPSDFRELLSLIAKSETYKRPSKVTNHLWSLAEEMYALNKDHIDLEALLTEDVEWEADPSENSNWELGFSLLSHRLLACKLVCATANT